MSTTEKRVMTTDIFAARLHRDGVSFTETEFDSGKLRGEFLNNHTAANLAQTLEVFRCGLPVQSTDEESLETVSVIGHFPLERRRQARQIQPRPTLPMRCEIKPAMGVGFDR